MDLKATKRWCLVFEVLHLNMSLPLVLLLFISSAFAGNFFESTVTVKLHSKPLIDIDLKNTNEAPNLEKAFKQRSPALNFNAADRIIGGSVAVPGQFPFHVLIATDSLCGGSLLNANWALTAAHCVYGRSGGDVYSITDVNTAWYWTSTIDKYSYISYYDPALKPYDIALIKLATPAPLTPNTNVIQLPRANLDNNFVVYQATVQGFGKTSNDDSSVSTVLKYITAPVMANSDCASTFDINEDMVCVKSVNGTGACQGDSGGGLFVGDERNHSTSRQIIGIVSFGKELCDQGYPVVYTRVTTYVGWIDYVMENN